MSAECRWRQIQRSQCRALIAAWAGMLLVGLAAGAAPQNAPEPAPDPVARTDSENAPPDSSGVLSTLGRWLDNSVSGVRSGLSSARNAVGEIGSQAGDAAAGAAGTARDAATSVIRIPVTSVVSGRERCPRAANGGPDCQPAIEALCRGKGFASGRSLDVQAAQKCPAAVWLSGRQPAEGECTMETYVTRAVCQ
jgi:hypothetical protein